MSFSGAAIVGIGVAVPQLAANVERFQRTEIIGRLITLGRLGGPGQAQGWIV